MTHHPIVLPLVEALERIPGLEVVESSPGSSLPAFAPAYVVTLPSSAAAWGTLLGVFGGGKVGRWFLSDEDGPEVPRRRAAWCTLEWRTPGWPAAEAYAAAAEAVLREIGEGG